MGLTLTPTGKRLAIIETGAESFKTVRVRIRVEPQDEAETEETKG